MMQCAETHFCATFLFDLHPTYNCGIRIFHVREEETKFPAIHGVELAPNSLTTGRRTTHPGSIKIPSSLPYASGSQTFSC